MGTLAITTRPFVSDTRFCQFYSTDLSTLDTFASELESASIIDNLKSLFTNKSDYVLSCRMYPFSINKFFKEYVTANPVVIGNTSMSVSMKEIVWTTSTGVTDTGITLLGTFGFTSRHFGNFMDFAPYTKVQVHIPFIGTYDLPVNELWGHRIAVYMGIDLYDGTATAWVELLNRDGDTSITPRVIFSQTAKIGVDIPIGRTNASEIARNNFLSLTKLASGTITTAYGMASGQSLITAGGVGLVTSSIANAVVGNTPQFSKGATPSGYMNLQSPTSTYLIITRPKPITNSGFASLRGKPLGATRTLSTLTGFTKVAKIHLENLGSASTEEITMVESLLKDGVIL